MRGVAIAVVVLAMGAVIGLGVVRMLDDLFPGNVAACPKGTGVVQEDDVKLDLEADHDRGRWMVTCTIDPHH